MNFRSYDGYTPLGDIARASGHAKSTVQTILDAGGGTTVMRKVPTWDNQKARDQRCILTKDAPALMALVASTRKYERRRGYRRSKRWQKPVSLTSPVAKAAEEPIEDTKADNAVELVRTLRRLKLLCEALGINMNEITFEDGKAKFPRVKEEVITL